MAKISNYPEEKMADLWNQIGNALESSTSVQGAAQTCMRQIYEAFSESIVLARLFMTQAFGKLSKRDQAFVEGVMETQGSDSFFSGETIGFSLLGTYGMESNWCDRYRSIARAEVERFTLLFNEIK